MNRDLRETPLYKEMEEHFRKALEPAFGKVSDANDAAPSPDGARIAFTGSKLDRLEGTPSTRICVADVRSGGFEEVTGGPNSDRLPRWSPDGNRLAFLSDRKEEGRHQLYLLQVGRVGEAVLTPAADGTVEYHHWSADGSQILLGVAGLGAELAGVQGSGSTAKGEAEEIPSWVPEVEGGPDETSWRRAWVFDLQGNESRPVSREGLNVWEAVWCGPGRIAAIVADGPGEETWYQAPLATIDLDSGKETVLYRSDRQLGVPASTPSGRRLAVIEAICSDRLVVAGDILLIDPDGGDPTRISTHGVDVTHMVWKDEDRLFYIGLRGMQVVAGELDASTGEAVELWASDESCGFVYPEAQPAGDGAFALVLQSYDRYPEVALIENGHVRTVASLAHDGSRYVRSLAGRLERVTWFTPDNMEIEGLLALPEGPGPHPLVANVHGGPIAAVVNKWGMRGILTAFLVSRGYAVLSPNPRGSSGRGQSFAQMVYGDMGGGDAQDIMSGIDALIERGIADPERLGVTGGSYGGFMSAWLVGQTERFAAAVAVSPVTDWYSQHLTSNIGHWDRLILNDDLSTPGGQYFARSPIAFAHRVRTPTLLTAGSVDRCTPPGQAREFYQALLENGVETELAIYPGEGHGVRKMPATIDFAARLVGWFERHMPGSSTG
jgi:dipeptidyl aminopeptidase/acylaminoacyl peptidase